MSFEIWVSGVVWADTTTKLITGFWDNQELAEYALRQIV